MSDVKPQFEHDCDACEFLGIFTDDNGRKVDGYCCGHGDDMDLVARHSDEPSDYGSLPFVSINLQKRFWFEMVMAVDKKRNLFDGRFFSSPLVGLLFNLCDKKAKVSHRDFAAVIDQMESSLLFDDKVEGDEKSRQKALAFLNLARIELS